MLVCGFDIFQIEYLRFRLEIDKYLCDKTPAFYYFTYIALKAFDIVAKHVIRPYCFRVSLGLPRKNVKCFMKKVTIH